MKRRQASLNVMAAVAVAVMVALWVPPGVQRLLGGPQRAWAMSAAPAGDAARGREVYLGWCAGCHGVDGYGRARPHLTALRNAEPEFLHAWISEPRMINPGTRMPRVGLTSQEIRDVAAWLRSQ